MNDSGSYILFRLGEGSYAVRTSNVEHIEMLEHVTPVPNAAPAVDGVVFSRGKVVPAISLRARFGMARQPHTAGTRLIFVRAHDRLVALIVDSAREFQRISADLVRPGEASLTGIEGNYVEGTATVSGKNVLIIDVGAVLTLEEATVPEQAGSAS
ncbi:MAG TPA: chemotaxis protein CheW [Opitutaceae bacterium]|jgi:purine-binding chemotaxis protein CheW